MKPDMEKEMRPENLIGARFRDNDKRVGRREMKVQTLAWPSPASPADYAFCIVEVNDLAPKTVGKEVRISVKRLVRGGSRGYTRIEEGRAE